MERKNYYLILDTETANSLEEPLVYDIGYQVVDRQGNVYERESLVIYEVFVKEKELMKSAYYAEKIPEYEERLKNGESRLVRFFTAWKIIKEVMAKYHIFQVGAYNASFDRKSLNYTLRYLSSSKYRYFMPYHTEWFCIWHMACQVLMNKPKFYRMAEQEGWFSPAGNLVTNAEICYRYLIGGHEFTEEHKGLDDVVIETFIFSACIAQHKKMDWSIKRNCWNIPNKGYSAYLDSRAM